MNYSEGEDFRAEVREFLRRNLPSDMAARGRISPHPARDDYLGWARILSRQGWSVPGWPAEHGGCGWLPAQRQIFEEEAMTAGAPPFHIQSVFLAGPLIARFGSAAQKAQLLPSIREGRELWAQGFSEPDAGSDLASLRTRAIRDGDHYVITGQKIWTSDAHMADRIFCLARTTQGGKPQLGISMFLFPLDLPGITIRPIPLIDGGHSLCEIFLEDVRVPADTLLGEEGQGWTYAKFLLDNERTTTAEVPRNKREIARLKQILTSRPPDPLLRRRLAEIEIDMLALEHGVETALSSGHDDPRPRPSILKLQGTELMQTILETEQEALGSHGAIFYPAVHAGPDTEPGPALARGVAAEFLFRRAATIYGGSSEIQCNIIAKQLMKADEHQPDVMATDEGVMLADSLRHILTREHGFGTRRAILGDPARQRELWALFAAQGWLGVTLEERVGGFGGTVRDGTIIARAMGRALAVPPMLGNLLAARTLAATNGPSPALDRWVAGRAELALAHRESEEWDCAADIATMARRDADGGFTLSGRKTMVLGAGNADHWVLSARAEDSGTGESVLSLFLVPREAPGLAIQSYRTIDGAMVADLLLDEVRVAPDALVGTPGEGLPLIRAALARTMPDLLAEMVGVMEQAMWISRDYLLVRRQFGQPLADFQALRHRLARMYLECERAGAMLDRAIGALDDPSATARDAMLAAAAARIGKSGLYVTGQAIQLHGGIALTEEYPVGHYFKRMHVLLAQFGHPARHIARYIALSDASPESLAQPEPQFAMMN